MSKEDKNKKDKQIIDKVVMGAVIGGAIGSVLGATFAPKKKEKITSKIKEGSKGVLSKTLNFLRKRKMKKVPHEKD